MRSALQKLESVSDRACIGAVVAGTAIPLLATAFATGAADAALAAVAALSLVAGAALGLHRARLAREPLVLAGRALRGQVDGATIFRFRARLGRGRPMRRARARVRFVPIEGAPIELQPVLAAADVLLGAWTIAVADPHGVTERPGRLEVEVVAHEGERTWRATSSHDPASAELGRFSPDFTVTGGRFAWRPETWDAVLPEDD